MVQEINYSQYKDFCKRLPCKDIFYFLENLFVKFPFDSVVYAIKYDIHTPPQEVYDKLIEQNMIMESNINEFLNGLSVDKKEALFSFKETKYVGKSYLVKL